MITNKSSPITGTQGKKAYIKPQIEKISLMINESVLSTGCKATTLNGPGDPGAEIPCIRATQCILSGT